MCSLSLIIAHGRLATNTSSQHHHYILAPFHSEHQDGGYKSVKSSRESNKLDQIAFNSQYIRLDRNVTELQFLIRHIEG